MSQKIQSEYQKSEEKRLSNKKRERKVGAGHPLKMPLSDRILMLVNKFLFQSENPDCGILFGNYKQVALKMARI
ncbi:MAG: hypothetical protein QXW38_07145 [Candidatus Nitrosotenuis sp.]